MNSFVLQFVLNNHQATSNDPKGLTDDNVMLSTVFLPLPQYLMHFINIAQTEAALPL